MFPKVKVSSQKKTATNPKNKKGPLKKLTSAIECKQKNEKY